MNQDVERIADRLKHLEEKEKAAKKLKKQAANEYKKNEKVRKARQQLRDLISRFYGVFHRILGRRKGKPRRTKTASGGSTEKNSKRRRRRPKRQETLTD